MAVPVLLAVAGVIAAANSDGIPLGWAWRVIVAVGLVTMAAHAAAAIVLRSFLQAAAPALAFSFWLQGQIEIAFLALLIAPVTVVLGIFQRRQARWAVRLDSGMHAFAGILALSVVVPYLSAHVRIIEQQFPRTVLSATPDSPDIMLILLDGYPRADTLRTQYGFDNSPFLGALEELGFDVASNSHSNYNFTRLTLLSTFNMAHVVDLNLTGSPSEQKWAAWHAMEEPAAVQRLRRYGYEVTVLRSHFGAMSIGSADVVLDRPELNGFETARVVGAARRGPLGGLLRPVLAGQHRSRLLGTLDSLDAIEDKPGPGLVFAHVLLPHPPFVFGSDGEARPLQGCFPTSCGFWDGWRSQLNRHDFSAAATDQIAYTNRRILQAVARLVNRPDPPVVILFSDHGSRSDPDDPDEMLRNLFAAYTPAEPGLFGEDPTPISIFPRLLGAYFDEDIPEPPGWHYLVDMRQADQRPFAVQRFGE